MFRRTFFLTVAILSFHVQSSVVIMGTRVIYPAQDRSVNVQIKNNSEDSPSLIQAWMDTGNPSATPDSVKVPFIITPPVFRIEPKSGQTMRVIYTREQLPTDRESLFYFNVLEIPAKPKANPESEKSMNYLQLAVRNRIKFFFRPEHLPVSQSEAFKQVSWSNINNNNDYYIRATNPTPYYITYNKIQIEQTGGLISTQDTGMIAPFSSANFHIAKRPTQNAKVKWTVVNDYGGYQKGESPLF